MGNGLNIRKFKKLKQYDPSRLPVRVLNNIYKAGGRLCGKGGKGSRSKYAKPEDKYVPKRSMKRARDWEERMRADPAVTIHTQEEEEGAQPTKKKQRMEDDNFAKNECSDGFVDDDFVEDEFSDGFADDDF